MRSFRKNKQGQFVVVAALIIAVLALATVISVYEISMNSQSVAYKPVDEFLLGTTSDMNRALTVALSRYSSSLVGGQETAVANSSGQQFMDDWQQSLFSSYPNYGFKLNQPISTYFDCRWGINPGYSSALTTYDFDVVSYGFIGWAGQTYKYVQLQLFNATRDGQNLTNVTFQLTQSELNQNNTVPIADMPANPNPSTFQIGAYTPGQPFSPITTSPSLTYLGNGVYSAVFNQAHDSTQGIRLDLETNDKVWVSATLNSGDGSTDSPLTPTLTTTPPSNAVIGQAFFDTATLSEATADASGTVTYTLYSGTPGSGTQIGQPSVVDVVNGQVPNSALYSAFSAGSYYFMASYSGDANNNPVGESPEPFTVNANPPPDSNKANPTITTTPPGSTIGIPSVQTTVTTSTYTQSSYTVTLKDPMDSQSGALGLSFHSYPYTYWVGQIPLQLTNGTATYKAIGYCMDLDKDASLGSAQPATLTPPTDNPTWRAVSYILSWANPSDDNSAAVQQVALWRTLDSSYTRPSWLSTSIDNQAAALAAEATGKDVARQGDTLKWISPLNGNQSSTSALPGSSITFVGQLTTSTGAPRPNVQLLFNANLSYGDTQLPLNSTYVNQAAAFTDSQGMVQFTVTIPTDTPIGAAINMEASTLSAWPQMYINLNSAEYQNLLVSGPLLTIDLSTNTVGSINVENGAVAGTPFSDRATLNGATNNAVGTVTYTLFKGTYPSGTQIGASQVTVTNGIVPNSASFIVNYAGDYYFLAAYSGDNGNNPAIGTAEPFTVGGSLSLTTTPPTDAVAGTPFSDQATLIGATDDASGTVTYKLYSGAYPSGTLVGTSQVSVSNGIVPDSSNFTVYSVGPYYFVAQYSGDGNNNPVNGEVEPFTVSMPQYSGKPFYFDAGGTTQDAFLNYLPPTYALKINSYISNGQTTSSVQANEGLYCDMVCSDKVNVTLYLGTSQPVRQLKIDVGFYYQDTYYDIGSATLYNIPKSLANKPYQATITININNQNFVEGYAPLTIPKGSIISVTTTAPDYNGRITLYYGPGQLSQVNF